MSGHFNLIQEFKKSPAPLGIKVIAALTFISAISFFLSFLSPPQSFQLVGAIFLSGVSLRIYFLVIVGIKNYITSSLLRIQKRGWVIFVIYYICIILLNLVDIFTISETILLKIEPNVNDIPRYLMSYKTSATTGLLTNIALLAYVLSKKKLFFKAAGAESLPTKTKK